MSWWSGLEQICRPDEPLAARTWYGLGGPARWFCMPRDERELATLLQRCAADGVAWRVLGRGANVLVRDEGVDAVVIHLTGPAWEEIRFDPPLVHAAAGVDFTKLVRTTLEAGLLGLEGLAGIPGSLGGVIRMNAGGKYGSISQYVHSVRLMQPDGTPLVRTAAELHFEYRRAVLDGCVVTGATLALTPGDCAAGLRRFREVWNEKHATQPPVSVRSAGCIFKNPPGDAAGRLIDAAGLKGTRCGGAEISRRHANFIEAHAGAQAADVLHLIDLARDRVREEFGIVLEPEVEIW
ncbi:MAG: UDP-N-acetylmuramate dehydrogenase [Planctomycetota bacterium]